MSAFSGILLGFPVLRLRGDYLAIVTLGFGEMVRIILLNWYEFTNGPDGISGIPRPSFFGLPFKRSAPEGVETFHGFFGMTYSPIDRIIFLYYLILIMAMITNLFTLRIRKLPVGRAWEALREDEIACRSLGINPRNTKLTAFAIGAMFAGFGGSFFATRQGFISPESFTFIESAVILSIVVLGGMGSQIGVVLAAILLIGLPEFFRELQQYRMLAFGAAMVLIMIWRPAGLLTHREPTVPPAAEGRTGGGRAMTAPAEAARAPEADAGKPLLTVEHLSMLFGGLVAIDDVSFEALDRRITAIIGPNGAGKTTVFNCLTGFYKPSVGRLTLHHPRGDFLLEQFEGFRIAQNLGVARTFQNIRLFPRMTVLENLIVAQHNTLMRASGYTIYGLLGMKPYQAAEKRAQDMARYWLDKVGLTGKADQEAGTLPYGEQRRLEVTRAMCIEPVLLCLDEPAAGLNARESAELNELLMFIRDEHKIGLLLIEHDMSVVMGISDYIVVLDYGRKISDGTPKYVRNDPAVISAYLGEGRRGRGSLAGRGGHVMLNISGVHTFYGNIEALKGVDLDVREGEIVTLIGANGAGKSTLLMTVCGNPRAVSGRVSFEGLDITRRSTHEIVRLGISQAPEGRRIFPYMTVMENLQMGATAGMPNISTKTWSGSSPCSPSWASAITSGGAPCPAANSRCWPSPAP